MFTSSWLRGGASSSGTSLSDNNICCFFHCSNSSTLASGLSESTHPVSVNDNKYVQPNKSHCTLMHTTLLFYSNKVTSFKALKFYLYFSRRTLTFRAKAFRQGVSTDKRSYVNFETNWLVYSLYNLELSQGFQFCVRLWLMAMKLWQQILFLPIEFTNLGEYT